MAEVIYYGTGRRKSSVARVRLVPGEGKVTINGRDMEEYFGLKTLELIVRQPLAATQTADKFDVLVNVRRHCKRCWWRRHGPGWRNPPRHHARSHGDERRAPSGPQEGWLRYARPARERAPQVRPQESPQGFPVLEALITAYSTNYTKSRQSLAGGIFLFSTS